jgi:hypothetical protein
MVGPSTSESERATARTRLKVGFVALVAVSGGLVALRGDPTLPQLVGAVVGATLVGGALLWFVVRILRDLDPTQR